VASSSLRRFCGSSSSGSVAVTFAPFVARRLAVARALSLCTPLMLAGLVVLLLSTVGEAAVRRQTASAGSSACGIAAGASVFTKQPYFPSDMQQPVTDGVVRLVGVANSDMADLTPFFRAVAIQGSNRGGVIRLKSDCDAAANPAQRALVEAVAVGTHAPDATGEQGTVAGLTGLLAQIRAGSLVSLWSQNSTNQSCATQGAAVPAKNHKCLPYRRSSTSSALTLSPMRVVMFMALFFSLLAVAGAGAGARRSAGGVVLGDHTARDRICGGADYGKPNSAGNHRSNDGNTRCCDPRL
jgi:hypothetical protein